MSLGVVTLKKHSPIEKNRLLQAIRDHLSGTFKVTQFIKTKLLYRILIFSHAQGWLGNIRNHCITECFNTSVLSLNELHIVLDLVHIINQTDVGMVDFSQFPQCLVLLSMDYHFMLHQGVCMHNLRNGFQVIECDHKDGWQGNILLMLFIIWIIFLVLPYFILIVIYRIMFLKITLKIVIRIIRVAQMCLYFNNQLLVILSNKCDHALGWLGNIIFIYIILFIVVVIYYFWEMGPTLFVRMITDIYQSTLVYSDQGVRHLVRPVVLTSERMRHPNDDPLDHYNYDYVVNTNLVDRFGVDFVIYCQRSLSFYLHLYLSCFLSDTIYNRLRKDKVDLIIHIHQDIAYLNAPIDLRDFSQHIVTIIKGNVAMQLVRIRYRLPAIGAFFEIEGFVIIPLFYHILHFYCNCAYQYICHAVGGCAEININSTDVSPLEFTCYFAYMMIRHIKCFGQTGYVSVHATSDDTIIGPNFH